VDNNAKPNARHEPHVPQTDSRGISSAQQRELYVRNVMTPHVITIKSSESIRAGASLMSENHISCLAVVDGHGFEGLITQEIALMSLVHDHANADSLRIGDHMLRTVATVSPDTSVLEASQLAHHESAKWLPVLTGQTVVGIITQTDLVQALMCFDSFPDVASIMTCDTIAIHAATNVVDAANVMTRHGISCIVAIQNDKVLGILTEKDLLKTALKPEKDLTDICVVDIMSFPVIAARPSDSMISASRLMDRMHIHHLAVMENEQLCGIITRTDVLKAFQQSLVQYTGLHDLVAQTRS
jgi:predicted transcriptional regulator